MFSETILLDKKRVKKTTVANNSPNFMPPEKFVESRSMLKACIPAHCALAAYSQTVNIALYANQYLSTMQYLDAIGAMQLSGKPMNVADTLIASDAAKDKKIRRYVTVMKQGLTRLEDHTLDNNFILDLASALSHTEVSVRRGELSEAESNGVLSGREVPAGSEQLQELLQNWQTFYQSSSGDMDILVLVALAHAQFMNMRVFTQGNVLTAQMLNILMLREESMLPVSAFPLSQFFSKHSEQYWRYLHEAETQGKWEQWIMFFLRAIAETAQEMTLAIESSGSLIEQLKDDIMEHLPKQLDYDVLLNVCARPSCGIPEVVESGLARRQTAATYLHKLEEANVIREVRCGREKRFVYDPILKLFT